MKYAVTWMSELECSLDILNFEEKAPPLTRICAKDKKTAVRKFLLKHYENSFDPLYWLSREDVYEYVTKEFVNVSVDGDDDEISSILSSDSARALAEKLGNEHTEWTMKKGRIIIDGEKTYYSYSQEDSDECREQMEKNYRERIIQSLTEKETEELFIQANMYDIAILPLEEL